MTKLKSHFNNRYTFMEDFSTHIVNLPSLYPVNAPVTPKYPISIEKPTQFFQIIWSSDS